MQRQSLREANARDEAEGMRKQADTIIDASRTATDTQLNESRARQAKLTGSDKDTIKKRLAETNIQTGLVISQKKAENAQLEKLFADTEKIINGDGSQSTNCLLYTSPSPRDS